jgi:hypothetical protein
VVRGTPRLGDKRRQYDTGRGTPSAWLLAITADQARQARRRRPLAWLSTDMPGRVRSTDDRLDVEFAIARLPPRQRLAVDCFYFAGLSVADTAAVMRCSEGTVKSTLSDARNRLKPLLEIRGERHRHLAAGRRRTLAGRAAEPSAIDTRAFVARDQRWRPPFSMAAAAADRRVALVAIVGCQLGGRRVGGPPATAPTAVASEAPVSRRSFRPDGRPQSSSPAT